MSRFEVRALAAGLNYAMETIHFQCLDDSGVPVLEVIIAPCPPRSRYPLYTGYHHKPAEYVKTPEPMGVRSGQMSAYKLKSKGQR